MPQVVSLAVMMACLMDGCVTSYPTRIVIVRVGLFIRPATWSIVQGAFAEDADPGLGPLVRERIREKNVERGIAATIGYISTLAAWLGGDYVDQDADVSLMLHWLSEAGPEYLESKQRDFVQEVRKKQKRYGSQETEMAS
jgi:hypothetical protein